MYSFFLKLFLEGVKSKFEMLNESHSPPDMGNLLVFSNHNVYIYETVLTELQQVDVWMLNVTITGSASKHVFAQV